MSQKGSIPPAGRRTYSHGAGGISQLRLGAAVYRSPRLKIKKTPTRPQFYAQQTMAAAAVFVKMQTTWERETCSEIAGRSGYTWRDQYMAMLYGTGIEFTTADGVLWQSRRELAMNIQQLLDSISSNPGSVLVRTNNGWAALYPGAAGYVLTINAATNIPDWELSVGAGKGAISYQGGGSFMPSEANTLSTNTAKLNGYFVPQNFIAKGVMIYVRAFTTAQLLTPVLYSDVGAVPSALLASGPQHTVAAAGLLFLPFTADYKFSADSVAWFGVQAVGTSNSYAQCGGQLTRTPAMTYPPPATCGSITGSSTLNVGMLLKGEQS